MFAYMRVRKCMHTHLGVGGFGRAADPVHPGPSSYSSWLPGTARMQGAEDTPVAMMMGFLYEMSLVS